MSFLRSVGVESRVIIDAQPTIPGQLHAGSLLPSSCCDCLLLFYVLRNSVCAIVEYKPYYIAVTLLPRSVVVFERIES